MIHRILSMAALAIALMFFAAAGAAHAEKRIAITFDDAPRQSGAFFSPDERSRRLIRQLRRARVAQAAFFVTPGNLSRPDGANGEAHITAYVRAGHVIANHSFSHSHLNGMVADAYLADIDRATQWLAPRNGYRPWFRFPFLDEGWRDKEKRDAVRAGLAARGLRNGYVTVDGSDWSIEANCVAAVQAGQAIDRHALRDLYVETHVEAAETYDRLAIAALGRSPAHVLLLHETDIAALYLTDLVRELRRRGWRIISADEAYRDPIGAMMPDVPVAQGPLTESLAWERNLPAPRWYERNDVRIANRLFAERVLHRPTAQ